MTAAALCVGLALVSVLYHVAAVFCAVGFACKKKREARHPDGSNWPRVACLKPLCGHEFEAERNLESFIRQDYPAYEVVFGTADSADSAYETARAVCRGRYGAPARVVAGEAGGGANRKVRNLLNIEAQVSSDAEVLVLSDSDTRVTGDYLKQMVGPIRKDATVGAVTALYRIENVQDLGGLLEALSVEATFVPGVLVAAAFSRLRYAFGASIALRRSDFVRAGGFGAVENFLADDYKTGNNVFSIGKRVVLAPCVISIYTQRQSVAEALAHLVRWNRTIRVCQPAGYFFSIICNTPVWALAALAALGPGAAGFAFAGLACFIRMAAAAAVAVCIGSRRGTARAVLSPLWDVLSLFVWLAGLFGSRITWRNVTYKLLQDGQICEIRK